MNKNKNILIIGPSRAGKTKLSEKLIEEMGYTHIIIDAIIETFAETFPEVGIKHGVMDNPVFINFLKSYLPNLFKYGFSNIIDMELLSPQKVNEMIDNKIISRDEVEVVYIGYPNVKIEDKLNQIRQYDTDHDWTKNLSDEELKTMIQEKIGLSKRMQEEAEKCNFTFVDTSYDRESRFEELVTKYRTEGTLKRTEESFDKYKRYKGEER